MQHPRETLREGLSSSLIYAVRLDVGNLRLRRESLGMIAQEAGQRSSMKLKKHRSEYLN